MKLLDFSKLYFAFVIFHLAVIYRPDEILHMVSKPLLVLSLVLYFIHRTSELKNSSKYLVVGALVLSVLGDVLLIQTEEIFFLAGVGAFALAHVAYAIFFNGRRSGSIHIPTLIGNVILVVFLLLGLNNWVDIPSEMVYPVNIYGAILGLNLVASVQFNYSNNAKNYWVPIGVGLFVISDLLLAVNKFNGYAKMMEIVVMTTYGLAQYLIMIGILSHFKLKKEPIAEVMKDQNGSTS